MNNLSPIIVLPHLPHLPLPHFLGRSMQPPPPVTTVPFVPTRSLIPSGLTHISTLHRLLQSRNTHALYSYKPLPTRILAYHLRPRPFIRRKVKSKAAEAYVFRGKGHTCSGTPKIIGCMHYSTPFSLHSSATYQRCCTHLRTHTARLCFHLSSALSREAQYVQYSSV